jgi:uncharacterized membrane protein YgcG
MGLSRTTFKYMTMQIRLIPIVLFTLFALASNAQGVKVQGQIVDAKDNSPVIGASVFLSNLADSTTQKGAVTDFEGVFVIPGVRPGEYKLGTSYISYQPAEMMVRVDTSDVALGIVRIAQDANLLKEILVEGKQVRVQQLGDTTQFNAAAFKTNPNATVEDLVQKMPGITLENGVLKVQGEELKKVTIDGEDFFGDDATVALKNLPAEIVDKIQVFDRLSEQSQFTGFDDGNTQKTLNIVTKSGKANGQFGKIYAGAGPDNRYIAGANLNYFKGKRRISLIGLSNNLNQQNFSSQDLLGITGSEGGGRGGGGNRGGGRSGGDGGSANNFLVGQQAGVSTVNSLGLNFSDRWGKKIKVNGAYFFNNNRNENSSELTREYFLNETGSQFYQEANRTESDNFNHRVNARLELNLDSANTISLRPQISFQDNSRRSSFLGQNYFTIEDPLNTTENNTRTDNSGYSFSNDLLYRHRFDKKGRTFSANIGTSFNDKTGDRRLLSQNQYFTGVDTSEALDQLTLSASNGLTLSSNLAFTEPIGKQGQVQFNYTPSLNRNSSDRETNSLDSLTGGYTLPDVLLSNQFENEVTTHRAGVNYQLRKKKINFSVGLNYQNVRLNSDQVAPTVFNVDKTFQNVLPSASFNFRPSKAENLRIQYRTSTNVPSVNQLQNVLDNSNTLLLSIGNPELKQPFGHTLSIRFNKNNAAKATSFVASGFVGITPNYIGNSTRIASVDTVVLGNIPLLAGAQLTRPVNLEGYWNARSFFTYGMPLGVIKSNLNLNTGFSYLRTPSLVNDQKNLVNTYTTNAGVVLSSNISEKLDFTLSYSANFNVVNNSLQPQLNNNFFFHNTGLKLNWEFAKRTTFSNDLNQTLYSGLGQGFNQQYWLWNVAIGYRMLKNEALELRLGVFDLLNQNNSIGRTVTETYVEDSVTDVLKRYFMLTATYSLRNFGGKK